MSLLKQIWSDGLFGDATDYAFFGLTLGTALIVTWLMLSRTLRGRTPRFGGADSAAWAVALAVQLAFWKVPTWIGAILGAPLTGVLGDLGARYPFDQAGRVMGSIALTALAAAAAGLLVVLSFTRRGPSPLAGEGVGAADG